MTVEEAIESMEEGNEVRHPSMKENEAFHRNDDGTFLRMGIWSIPYSITKFARDNNAMDDWYEVKKEEL